MSCKKDNEISVGGIKSISIIPVEPKTQDTQNVWDESGINVSVEVNVLDEKGNVIGVINQPTTLQNLFGK